MALINCKNCGHEISDKAKVCPHCGELLLTEENKPELDIPPLCEECGEILPPDAKTCPNCGCPVEQKTENDETQRVEVTSVNIKVQKKTKKLIIIASISVAVVILATVLGIVIKHAVDKRKAENAINSYRTTMNSAASEMLSGAAKAESSGNLIKSVWYNTIYEKSDPSTDKYTKKYYSFNDDFNDSLALLFADESFQKQQSEIESSQKQVEAYMKSLTNPPDGFEEAYQSLKKMYDSYVSFTNLVLNPSGSLQTYSSSFNNLDSEVLTNYQALKLYL